MKISEFFDQLRRTRGWKCEDDGSIYRVRRDGTVECPITAVANKIAGRNAFPDPDYWCEASAYLRLPARCALDLVFAADADYSAYEKDRQLQYRQRLLQACRIKAEG